MNVTVLSTASRNAGGLFYSVRWLSQSLQKRGCGVTVLSPLDQYSQEDLGVWEDVDVLFYRGVGPTQYSSTLPGLLAGSQPELIHLHGIWQDSQRVAQAHQCKSGTPVVVSPRGMLDPWAVNNSAWKKQLVGKLYADEALNKASCIHALCRSEADSIRAYGLKNPIAVIPNGVELPELEEQEEQDQHEGRKKLLFLGRIHPKKGLAELISGWAKAKRSNPAVFAEWQLVIAGWDDGNHLEGLKQQASQSGLLWSERSLTEETPDILFIGPQFGEEKDRLLRSVNGFVLPSFSEGLPMSVLEAWSYALPVVMTEFCNIPEGFEANAAIRVEPNTDSVAGGLSDFMSLERAELKQLGENGRLLVERSFTWERIAGDMKMVYDWCLGGDMPACVEIEEP